MYNHIFNSQTRSISSAALVLAVASLISGLLGLFRDRLLAGRFGAGNELDIYYAAFRIPDFITMVLVMGAITAAIIPIFSSYLVRSRKEAWEFFANLLNLFLFFLVITSAILIIFVPQLLSLIVPGFVGEKREMTILLTRIMFLSPILLGISNIISGVLRVFRRFLVTSLAPIMYNLGIIFGILFFVPWLKLQGLAWGVVLGGFLHLFVQLPILLRLGFKSRRILNFSHPGFLKTIKLTLPRALGLAAGQINLIVITAIASFLATGSITVFNLANNLQKLPITLIAVSFSSAAFPFLSIYFSKKNREKLISQFSFVFRQILFLIVPVSLLLFILRAQIVRVILGTGKFSWADTQLTAACLGLFSIGIFGYGLTLLISKTFYALHNTKIPALVTLLTITLNIGLSFFFIWLLKFENPFQQYIINFLDLEKIKDNSVIGLPLALSLSGIFQLFLLLGLLYKKIGDPVRDYKNEDKKMKELISNGVKEILKSLGKILIASVLLVGVALLARQIVANFVNMQTFTGIFLQGLISALAGISVYILAALLLRSPEIFAKLTKERS